MTSQDTAQLTRAEAAYAHLASFKRGDRVTVTASTFTIDGTVTDPQRDGATILGAYLTIAGTMTMTLPDNHAQREVGTSVIAVDNLLHGYAIRGVGPAAGYAAQNG